MNKEELEQFYHALVSIKYTTENMAKNAEEFAQETKQVNETIHHYLESIKTKLRENI